MKLFGKKSPVCNAVIVAAGSASRMGGIDKVMEPICGLPMIVRTALVFQQSRSVEQIVIVTRGDLIQRIRTLCAEHGITKLLDVIPGGSTRTESVCNGLNRLPKNTTLAAVHDGARPLVTTRIIEETVARAATGFAAAPAIPVKDTIKVAANRQIQSTPDRSTLYAVQTPQIFDFDLLQAALANAQQKGLTLTDECSAVEALGKVVYLTDGSDENLKVTTPVDLAFAEAILKWREAE